VQLKGSFALDVNLKSFFDILEVGFCIAFVFRLQQMHEMQIIVASVCPFVCPSRSSAVYGAFVQPLTNYFGLLLNVIIAFIPTTTFIDESVIFPNSVSLLIHPGQTMFNLCEVVVVPETIRPG